MESEQRQAFARTLADAGYDDVFVITTEQAERLTDIGWWIIHILESGGRTIPELVEKLDLPQNEVTSTVESLIEHGIVTREGTDAETLVLSAKYTVVEPIVKK